MSKGAEVDSSMSERPEHQRPRRLADWLNPTGERKVHSLIDKVYKRKNLEMAWGRVKANRGAGGVDGQSIDDFTEVQKTTGRSPVPEIGMLGCVSSEGWPVQQGLEGTGDSPAGVRIRSPVAWIAGRRETEFLKPIDKVSLGEIASHRAVTRVNAQVASTMYSEGAPSRNPD